ncbi:MAG: hypothetical protein K2Y21_14300 [Phycisphaerales bacterium]|nr:hypothetical protein [Phycisphaerales bacterium]
MQTRRVLLAGGACALSVASLSLGAVTYLTQARSITASTSFDGALQTLSAPDFNPFVQTINLSTTFPAFNNTIGKNEAVAGIDCQLDPNKIKALGRLTAAGGTSFVNGKDKAEEGNASVSIRTTFHLDADSAYQLVTTPRPLAGPKDKFTLKIESVNLGVIIFLDESSPPTAINQAGFFAAGDYSLEYQVEITSSNGSLDDTFEMTLTIPTPATAAALLLGAGLATRRRR